MRKFLFILSWFLLPLLTVEAEEPQTTLFVSDIPELMQLDFPVPLLSDILLGLQLVLVSLNDTVPIHSYRIVYDCRMDNNTIYFRLTERFGSWLNLCEWKRVPLDQESGINNGRSNNREFCRKQLNNMINDTISKGYDCANAVFFIGVEGRKRLVKIL